MSTATNDKHPYSWTPPWVPGEIVRVHGPGGYLMAVDPATRKSTKTPQLMVMGEDPKVTPYPLSSPDYAERLKTARDFDVTSWNY